MSSDVTDVSKYLVALEPPVGTSYFKEYKTAVSQSFIKKYYGDPLAFIGGARPFTTAGWTVATTIEFYIYVTLKKPTDTNFTADGGKVYVIAKYSGDVHPAANMSEYGFLDSFKYGFEDVTSTQLLSPVKDLPDANQEHQDKDVYTYELDYSQIMSMFKSNGNDVENFTAVDNENFTRTGWKQSPDTSSTYQGYKCQRVVDPNYDHPKIYGFQVWVATSLGKASLKISSNASFDDSTFDDKSDTYELDFSADTMKNSSA